MCRMRIAGLVVYHLLAVSVIRADKQYTVRLLYSLNSGSHALIHGLYRGNGCRDHTGMANHIRVCKVDDDHIILAGTDCFIQLRTHFGSAHLRLQVIGCNRGGLHEDTILILVGLLDTAVEEEGYMRVLLCLGKSKLL